MRPILALVLLLVIAGPSPLAAQWTNRYPHVDGFGHHVYLEGYDLPLLTNGPIDPAPAPDGNTIAVAARGWIWLLNGQRGAARRLTRGPGMDSRPAWAPDGATIAFVRDDGSDTQIVLRNIASGDERVLNTSAIDLDPAFSPDGASLFYASAQGGTIDLWRHDLATSASTRITGERGSELRPQPHPDGRHLVYLGKRGADQIMLRELDTHAENVLVGERLMSMTRPALSPDGGLVAYNWATQDGYELRLLRVDDPSTTVRLTTSRGLPLTPAWSADGRWVYFSEADGAENMQLLRIRSAGGPVEPVPVRSWEWDEPTARLRIVTHTDDAATPAAARLGVLDRDGHPAIPDDTQSRFDGQSGRVFFYSPGVVELEVPVGTVTVSAVQGLATPETTRVVNVPAGGITEVRVGLSPVWDAAASGWLAGDHHFHLNYGGPYRLTADDLPPMLAAEGIDVATPLIANLHNRFEDQRLWNTPSSGTAPMIRFGQEVRSHFLGHVGLVGIDDLFWPWIWGPGYQVYGQDDRPNTDALAHARNQGGLSTYVHPYAAGTDPFGAAGIDRIGVEILVDGVLGAFDLLEIVCLWSNSRGTAELWYRLLNIGVPIGPSAGTDVMNNFYRTMAIGTTRVYVQTSGETSWSAYTDALRAGRSFVTTGPLLEFTADGIGPGGVVGTGSVDWALDVHATARVDSVELLVNGHVVWRDDGPGGAGSRAYAGTVELPEGGWIAVRAHGGEVVWPQMSEYPFAHTAPVWIGEVGSTEPATRRAAAAELLRAIELAERRLRSAYDGVAIPRLLGRFAEARQRLESAAR